MVNKTAKKCFKTLSSAVIVVEWSLHEPPCQFIWSKNWCKLVQSSKKNTNSAVPTKFGNDSHSKHKPCRRKKNEECIKPCVTECHFWRFTFNTQWYRKTEHEI